MAKRDILETLKLPSGVKAQYQEGILVLKGPKGEIQREFHDPRIVVEIENDIIKFTALKVTKREKTKLYTWRAHMRNMGKGVSQGHVYKLKICSGDFQINVAITGNILSVKNFLGEKVPRVITIPQKVTVKIDGEFVTVESSDKELAGQTAASMEQLTRITTRDLRIFQDGFYIIEKDGKEMK